MQRNALNRRPFIASPSPTVILKPEASGTSLRRRTSDSTARLACGYSVRRRPVQKCKETPSIGGHSLHRPAQPVILKPEASGTSLAGEGPRIPPPGSPVDIPTGGDPFRNATKHPHRRPFIASRGPTRHPEA